MGWSRWEMLRLTLRLDARTLVESEVRCEQVNALDSNEVGHGDV